MDMFCVFYINKQLLINMTFSLTSGMHEFGYILCEIEFVKRVPFLTNEFLSERQAYGMLIKHYCFSNDHVLCKDPHLNLVPD